MKILLEKLNSEIRLGRLADLKKIVAELGGDYSQFFVITDKNVAPHFLKKVLSQLGKNAKSIILPPGEKTKTLQSAQKCWEAMHKAGMDRKTLVIALGGGVITDLAGFVAGTYMRGVDTVYIPTTLMGMVDASIGGKNAVNLSTGKNIVGTIHQPRLILIDPALLKSLPERELKSGIAECIKHGIIWNEEYFNFLDKSMPKILSKTPKVLEKTIWESCHIKAQIVEQDPKEFDLRVILNFGHTFGHALETITNYKKYLHGEAVAIGISCAASVSHILGYCDANELKQINALIKKAGLDIRLPKIDLDAFINLMTYDKKAVKRQINLILVHELGTVSKFNDVDRQIIKLGLNTKRAADDAK